MAHGDGNTFLGREGGLVGGLATVASHGPQVANCGLVGGLATVASHGPQVANCGFSRCSVH